MPGPDGTHLAGRVIGVTAHRRAEDLIGALERRGARVLHAPALRVAPVADDAALLAEVRAVLAAAPDLVLVTTAYGLRRWWDAAESAGLADDLQRTLARARILVRGPKARGAVRALGLRDEGISADETTATLIGLALAGGVAGRSVAVQVHGFTDHAGLDRLRSAGAAVLTVTPYRWLSAEEDGRLPALIDAVCARQVDALTFTSAPAVDAVLSSASARGSGEAFLTALRVPEAGGLSPAVVSAAVGPVTAAPLHAAGIVPLVPERFRLGALVRLLSDRLGPA